MVKNAVRLKRTISEVLNTTEANTVQKLQQLNINPYL